MIHFLQIVWDPKSEGIPIFGDFKIHFYSMMWMAAFVLGWYLMKKIYKHENQTEDKLDSLFIYSVLGIMIGARLGHVIFYDWDYYKNHLLEILLPIRESNTGSLLFGLIDGYEFTGFTGLASHGATIGVILGMYIYTRKFP